MVLLNILKWECDKCRTKINNHSNLHQLPSIWEHSAGHWQCTNINFSSHAYWDICELATLIVCLSWGRNWTVPYLPLHFCLCLLLALFLSGPFWHSSHPLSKNHIWAVHPLKSSLAAPNFMSPTIPLYDFWDLKWSLMSFSVITRTYTMILICKKMNADTIMVTWKRTTEAL